MLRRPGWNPIGSLWHELRSWTVARCLVDFAGSLIIAGIVSGAGVLLSAPWPSIVATIVGGMILLTTGLAHNRNKESQQERRRDRLSAESLMQEFDDIRRGIETLKGLRADAFQEEGPLKEWLGEIGKVLHRLQQASDRAICPPDVRALLRVVPKQNLASAVLEEGREVSWDEYLEAHRRQLIAAMFTFAGQYQLRLPPGVKNSSVRRS
jgi:hypothetical protein